MSDNLASEIERLHGLLLKGAVTEAEYAAAKAKLLGETTSNSAATRPQGYWEYRTFVESLGNIKVKGAGWKLDGGIGHPDAERAIEAAAKRLISSLAPDGWEPDEPYDSDSLSRKGHVTMRDASPPMKWGSGTDYRLIDVRINFRRWTTGTAQDASAESEAEQQRRILRTEGRCPLCSGQVPVTAKLCRHCGASFANLA